MAWGDTSPVQNELSELWNQSEAGSINVSGAWIEFEMLRIEFEPARIDVDLACIEFEKSPGAADI